MKYFNQLENYLATFTSLKNNKKTSHIIGDRHLCKSRTLAYHNKNSDMR